MVLSPPPNHKWSASHMSNSYVMLTANVSVPSTSVIIRKIAPMEKMKKDVVRIWIKTFKKIFFLYLIVIDN